MSEIKLKKMLDQVARELESEEVESSTGQLTRELSQDIHDYLAGTEIRSPVPETLLDQVQALEVEFSQSHPRIEGIFRELIDTLSKMGV